MDTITLKSSMPNIISNRSFYSDHSTYLWALYIGRVFRQCYNEIINHYAKEIYQRKRRTNERMGLGTKYRSQS